MSIQRGIILEDDYIVRLKKFINKKHMGKRVLSAAVVASLIFAVPMVDGIGNGGWFTSMEAQAQTAAEKKAEAEKNLNAANNRINELKEEQDKLKGQLSTSAAKLADIRMAQESLQAEIDNVEAAIAQSEIDLAAAEEQEKQQYEAMKLRIQFMYENGSTDSVWTAILDSNGIADMLNRIEYVTQVHNSDRTLMDNYEAAVQEVTDTKAALEEQHSSQQEMMASYDAQEVEAQKAVDQLKAESSDYQNQIATVNGLTKNYQQQIKEANEAIRQEQLAAQQYQQSGGGSGSTNYTGGTGVDPANRTGVSGQDVVNFALQYVGRPYVWGGNSLENGSDCSGFVHLVYEHFGISTVRYSLSFANGGQAVSSDCLRPGDVIVYAPKNGIGHVAIYIGNGNIVEAQSTNAGITSSRRWNCRPVIAIRRYV